MMKYLPQIRIIKNTVSKGLRFIRMTDHFQAKFLAAKNIFIVKKWSKNDKLCNAFRTNRTKNRTKIRFSI
jgi:hypothetical protein